MLHFTQLWNLTASVEPEALENGIRSAAQFGKRLFQGKGQKRFIGFSHRLIPPQQTLKTLVKEKQKIAGITRVSDITDLDVIGIPTYVAIRPEACFATPLEEGRISIYNGKGFTKTQAKASALMEAFERRAGEPYARKPIIASYKEMKKFINCVDPNSLRSGAKDELWRTAPIEWMIGIDLMTRKPVAVQAINVFSPYVSPPGTIVVHPFHSSTGLASGNTLLEATVHATLEVIERHATAPEVESVEIFSISIESIKNKWVKKLIGKLLKHGMNVGLKYYKTRMNLPVCRASIDDPITRDPSLLCYGTGCHLSRDVALVRALTEAVQTRLTVITGTREDLPFSEELRGHPDIYDELCKKFWTHFELKNLISYEKIPHHQYRTLQGDLAFILKELKKNGTRRVVAVDLTREDVGVPVVRVVVPDLPIEYQLMSHVAEIAEDVRKRLPLQ